ncbi:hypothetical protein ACFL1G_06935 [Planctomycetota bacterium]
MPNEVRIVERDLVEHFRKKTKFVCYRLLDDLQELARLKQLRFGEILFEPLKNG